MPRKKTEWTEPVQVKLSPTMKALAMRHATDAGAELATWIRGLIAERIGWAEECEKEREKRRQIEQTKEEEVF